MYLPMTIPSRLETTATTWSGMPFAPPAKRTTAKPARKPMPQAAMPISYSLRITIRPQRKPPTTAATSDPRAKRRAGVALLLRDTGELGVERVDKLTRPHTIEAPVLEHRRNRLLVGPGAQLLGNERDVVVGRLTRLLRLARLARIVPLHRDPLSHACVTRHLRRPACLSAMARLWVPGIPTELEPCSNQHVSSALDASAKRWSHASANGSRPRSRAATSSAVTPSSSFSACPTAPSPRSP